MANEKTPADRPRVNNLIAIRNRSPRRNRGAIGTLAIDNLRPATPPFHRAAARG
jgi:hypothetical protein